MTFIQAESNRSQITCIMVVTESDWMRIQNLPNRIGCGVKKTESAHLCYTAEVSMDRIGYPAGYLRFFWIRIGFGYLFLKKIRSGQDQDICLISITKVS